MHRRKRKSGSATCGGVSGRDGSVSTNVVALIADKTLKVVEVLE